MLMIGVVRVQHPCEVLLRMLIGAVAYPKGISVGHRTLRQFEIVS